ncbi:MAG: hypothetical protein HY878_05370 [Deltaproteobacteria bacterium]|nr:hypothetical protein [Deltaproteobacteria bacterium]
MYVQFPVDERSRGYIEELERDPDIQVILSILLDKRKKDDFSHYASIICFCYKEEDLINIMDVKHLPKKVKVWVKRMSFESDPTYLTFFKHLFSLYSSFVQTYQGWDKLGKYRSIFPEVYIFHRVKDRYVSKPNSIVERECFIVIDNWDSRIHRTREEGQKVDAGAWDPDEERGEVYEAKVKMYIKEKEHQLEFLETIKERSKGSIDVFLASFAPKQVMLKHLKSFFPDRDMSRINLVGIDELRNL